MKNAAAEELFRGLEAVHPERKSIDWQLSFLHDSYTGLGGYSYFQPIADKTIFGRDANQSVWSSIPTTAYLDRFPKELKESFANRLSTSIYVNFVAPIIDLYNDFLFRRKATRTAANAQLSSWLSSHDIEETSRKAMKVAQVYGTAFVVFDTQRMQASNLLDAINQGYTGVYPTVLEPNKVLSWGLNQFGELDWIKYRIVNVETDSPFEDSYEKVRWIVWTVNKWQVFEKAKDKNEASLIDEGDNPFKVVPVAVMRFNEPQSGNFLSSSQALELANINRSYYNRLSELTTLLRGQAFSQLVIPTPANNSEITVGLGSVLMVDPESKFEPKYISPDSANSELYETRLNELQNDLFRAAKLEYLRQQMTGRMQGNVSSGLSRGFSFSQCNAALIAMGKQAQKFEEQALRIVASFYNVDCDYVVNYPTDYEIAAGAADLMNLKEAIETGMPQTVITKLKRNIGQQLVNFTQEELKQFDKELEQPEKEEPKTNANAFENEVSLVDNSNE